MKKYFLIPTLLATTATPLISLSSCQNEATFEVNFACGYGGTLQGTTELKVKPGTKWCDIQKPEPKPKFGYDFAGWFLENTKLEDDDERAIDTVWAVVARFITNDKCLITFGCGENGTITGETEIEVEKNTNWSSIVKPTNHPDGGFRFAGWDLGGVILDEDEDYQITKSFSAAARFEPVIRHVVTLYANGGTFLDAPDTEIITFQTEGDEKTLGEVINNIQPVGLDGQGFAGWLNEDGNLIPLDTYVTTDLSLKATYGTSPQTKYSVTMNNPVEDGFTISINQTVRLTKTVIYVTSQTLMNSGSIEYISVGGVKLKNGYTFDIDYVTSKKAILTIFPEKVIGNISILFNKSAEPKAVDFETDSWQTVAYYANLGIDRLCEAYKHDESWFLGKKRKLLINRRQYGVVVAGTNQDQYESGGVYSTAALTFQFTNLISKQQDGTCLKIQWEANPETEQMNYWESTLENALNGEGEVDWIDKNGEVVDKLQRISVYQMFLESDPENLWTGLIKPVIRSVNVRTGSSWNQKSNPVKIFTPTLSNFYSEKGIKDEASQIRDKGDLYFNEGQKYTSYRRRQYNYYRQEDPINLTEDDQFYIRDHAVDFQTSFGCFKYTDIRGGGHDFYWLSSPCLEYGNESIIINTEYDGQVYDKVNEYHAVLPCFCI